MGPVSFEVTMRRQLWLKLGAGMLCAIAPLLIAPSAAADRRIIIRRTPERHEHHRTPEHRHRRYPVYERRQPVRRRVTVEFIAQGDDWANVYVDGRRIFSPANVDRRRRFTFREGAYEIKITGVDFFDVWAEGYLDVGRDDANIVVVSFSERGGVRVSGDPYAWIPLSSESRSSTRRRRVIRY